MQPISIKREAQFRGPSSSEEFNLWMDDAYFDLIQLFNFAAEYGARIPENMQMLVTENIFLQKRIKELQDLIDQIEATTQTEKAILHSFSSDGNLSDPEDYPALEHDSDFGLLKIPQAQEVSKLYLVDLNKQNFVPKTLKVRVYESTSPFDITTPTIAGTDVIEDTNLTKIFDGDKSSFWLRKASKTQDVSAVYFCLEIELPTNIINHTRANVISVDPTPLSSVTLLDTQYKSIVDWQRLETYPLEEVLGEMVPKPITELGRIKFCFPTRDVIALRIYGKQTNWFLENGSRSFYYGFRNIDVNYTAFKTEEFRTRVKFDIPDPAKQFTSIVNADPNYPMLPVFADGSIANNNLLHVYKIYVGDQEFDFGDTLPALTQSVQIEVGLDLSNEVSPLLSGLIIKYESA